MDYITMNRASWDEKSPLHVVAREYNVAGYEADPDLLSNVVKNDIPLLGDISGLDIIHLQCHIGTDTLSLARLGPKSVTGLDFSPEAIMIACGLANATLGSGGEKLRYVEATVDDALRVVAPASFDMVYVSIGSLCWLPRIRDWANTVAGLLNRGGRLFMRETHPMMWTIDDEKEELSVELPYFERESPIIFAGGGTYVEVPPETVFKTDATAEFFHGMGEIVTALIDAGMCITGLVDHQYTPFESLAGKMKKLDNVFADLIGFPALDEWQLIDRPERIPHTYTLQASMLS